jgi:hypothetical protein
MINTRTGAAVVAAIALAAFALYKVQRLEQFFTPQGTATTESTERERYVMHTPGGELGVATIKAYEDFVRTDPKQWAMFDLGTTTSEIRVAALFRYVIPLAKEWPIECDKAACIVHAPAVRASPPAAIYTNETRKYTTSGWARFNKEENLAALERSLTTELDKRASSSRNLKAAQEAGRIAVEQFVRTWVVKARSGKVARVVVVFPGETVDRRMRVGRGDDL